MQSSMLPSCNRFSLSPSRIREYTIIAQTTCIGHSTTMPACRRTTLCARCSILLLITWRHLTHSHESLPYPSALFVVRCSLLMKLPCHPRCSLQSAVRGLQPTTPLVISPQVRGNRPPAPPFALASLAQAMWVVHSSRVDLPLDQIVAQLAGKSNNRPPILPAVLVQQHEAYRLMLPLHTGKTKTVQRLVIWDTE